MLESKLTIYTIQKSAERKVFRLFTEKLWKIGKPVTCVQRVVACSSVWQTSGQRSERIYSVCVASVLRMSNVLDVLVTYGNKSSLCVVVVVIDHHVENNSFNLVLAKTVDPNKHHYFDTKLSQPSLAN